MLVPLLNIIVETKHFFEILPQQPEMFLLPVVPYRVKELNNDKISHMRKVLLSAEKGH